MPFHGVTLQNLLRLSCSHALQPPVLESVNCVHYLQHLLCPAGFYKRGDTGGMRTPQLLSAAFSLVQIQLFWGLLRHPRHDVVVDENTEALRTCQNHQSSIGNREGAG